MHREAMALGMGGGEQWSTRSIMKLREMVLVFCRHEYALADDSLQMFETLIKAVLPSHVRSFQVSLYRHKRGIYDHTPEVET